jgi:hypothetical protein
MRRSSFYPLCVGTFHIEICHYTKNMNIVNDPQSRITLSIINLSMLFSGGKFVYKKLVSP